MEYLLKASVVVLIFYLFYKLFLQRETFFQSNRFYLFIGLIIALCIPFVVIPIYIEYTPEITENLTPIVISSSNEVALEAQENVTKTAFNYWQLLITVYGAGVVFFLGKLLIELTSLKYLFRRHNSYKNGAYTLIETNEDIPPFSFFNWIVYNPKKYSKEELEHILNHEKVHAKEFHSLDIILSQLACVLFWFNPIMWLYKKEMQQNLEFIADKKAQDFSECEKSYQLILLKSSVPKRTFLLTNNFYNSQIKKRIIMLHKSKSSKVKAWKYLLILPLLAGLLMSMNTEAIYVEADTNTIDNKKTLEFVVTKSTTDKELKAMSGAVENIGETLVFSKIKRNNSNELTNIRVKLSGSSYETNNEESIESFIIYKELFDEKGGFIGRYGNGTILLDYVIGEPAKNLTIEKFTSRVNQAIVKSGIQSKEDLNNYIQKNASNKVQTKSKKKDNSKIQKKTSATQPNRNTKNIAMAMSNKSEEKSEILNDISITIIKKNTSDSELDKIKKNLKKEGVTVKFKGIKRNDDGEITAIKIEAKSKNSSTNFNTNSDEAISPIKIIYNEEQNTISIGNSNAIHGDNMFVFSTDDGKHKVHQSSNNSYVFVQSDDKHEHDEEHETKVYVKRKGKKGKVKRVKRTSNVHVVSDDDDDKVIEIIVDEDNDNEKETIIVNGKKVNIAERKDAIILKGKEKKVWATNIDDKNDVFVIELDDSKKNIFISDNNGKNPLYVIDGKEVSKEKIMDMNPESIESVTVLKDKSAIEKYGDKAKDGVIIIKTKKN